MPSAITGESGSFRDPAGQVYYRAGKVLRTVMPRAAEDFQFARDTGLLDLLVEQGRLVPYALTDRDALPRFPTEPAFVLEHPRIPFISYPYEWCFHALRDASVHQLELYLDALARDVMLSDATAYNIQFVGTTPVFIDHLSFRRYRDGETWGAHQQFCYQFLNPLLLRSLLGIAHHSWYRGSLEGIPTTELNQLVPWFRKCSWNVFFHVAMQARLLASASRSARSGKRAARVSFGKDRLIFILRGMRKWAGGLRPARSPGATWLGYAEDNGYGRDGQRLKREFVADFARRVRPGMLWDLGCNTGDYSLLALDNGAGAAIGFDNDPMSVEAAYLRAKEERRNFLPLCVDMANPSPGQGWRGRERAGLRERANADAVLALALLHHLVVGRNIPLDSAVSAIVALAPAGVIEFVPKEDPMTQRLLSLREDIFPDYTRERFESCLRKRARIVKAGAMDGSSRGLYWYARD